MKTAYENYCIVRDKMGYTDYKVAKETGIGTATMSNWKNGKYVPKSDKIQKIATLLNTTEKFIMDGEDEKLLKIVFYRTYGHQSSQEILIVAYMFLHLILILV